MSSILSTALTGLNNAVSRATQSAGNIVNASSTGKNSDADLINLKQSKTDYAVNAKVVKVADEMQKTLLDIKV